MNIDKIKSRIRKLLAMANDTSSPNEAAIAADRAAKLMRQYQLDHVDVIIDDLDDPDQLIAAQAGKVYKRTPAWLQHLSVSIAKATETQVRFVWVRSGKQLCFEGYRPDVELAEWLVVYLSDQIEQQAAAERVVQRNSPCVSYMCSARRYMTSFREGLSSGIRDKLAKFYADGRADVSDTARQLVAAKDVAIAARFGKATYGSRYGSIDRDGYTSGKEASGRVNVSRAVGGSRHSGPKLLGNG